ncbi:hypothetical protein GRS96_03230 [Rathayibacter sp. VKM Ac-2803]|uniref:hypothetical protein n=1 Tax=unclassified Rathayibacter TaxID=2609250 RepID=UPI001357DDAE|nr:MULTISPECIES: hypothetical protein [unclassified Rathayibacter]MWV48287.1 hypothetical protein [Rathayibacter sp. VKM Ac-2803]MWV59220.1 hypothetical protein [Rathayibacter sp. VKM Ac-2754]
MSPQPRLRRTRLRAALRAFLGLPTPFDEDQDDYWTALPRTARSDGGTEHTTAQP